MNVRSTLPSLALFTFLTLSLTSDAQHWCAADDMRRKAIEENPSILDASQMLEQYTAEFIRARSGQREDEVKVIPVVFHIIHMYGEENISDQQIFDAVDILNRDFRKLNEDTSQIVHGFDEIAADSRIEFRLAKKDFLGNCTNGIERIASLETYEGDDASKLHQWPRNMYLNIWVVADMEDGVAGYAYSPDAVSPPELAPKDGIVMRHYYVGSIGTSDPSHSRALTHEVGHYLNLQHVWGNTNDPGVICGDDLVEDTPETMGHTFCDLDGMYCNDLQSYENTQNYMDYSFCNMMYTEGQAARMNAALNSTVSSRNNLWSANNLFLTGLDGSPVICAPLADFWGSASNQSNQVGANPILICPGEDVHFFDSSVNGDPVSWEWTFEDGVPSTSTEENPVVVFNNSGNKTVSLTVTNSSGTSSKLQYHLVHVAWPEEITGLLTESFELALPFESWIVNNIDNNNTAWERVDNAGSTGTHSAMLNASETELEIEFMNDTIIYQGDNDMDELISPTMNLSLVSDAEFTFKYAYATKSSNVDLITEKLEVFISKDCGRTWFLRKSIDGLDLTTGGNNNDFYIPSANEWVQSSFNIPVSFQEEGIRFKFVFSSSSVANNVYVDDININGLVGVENVTGIHGLSIYPNPAHEEVVVSYNLLYQNNITIRLMTLDGRVVEQQQMMNQPQGTQQAKMNVDKLAAGIYFIQIATDKGMITQKLVVK